MGLEVLPNLLSASFPDVAWLSIAFFFDWRVVSNHYNPFENIDLNSSQTLGSSIDLLLHYYEIEEQFFNLVLMHGAWSTLREIFMILVSLENVTIYSHVQCVCKYYRKRTIQRVPKMVNMLLEDFVAFFCGLC